MRRRALGVAAAAATAVAAGLSACTHPAYSGGNGDPVVLCGTTFTPESNLVNFWTSVMPAGQKASYDGETEEVLIISVSPDCDTGSHVSWSPPSAAHIVQSAYAKDDLLAAVSLKPTSPTAVFTVTATRDGKLVGTINCEPR
jgi:hypothetical protein